MIRKIINIDENKCNGCGLCAQACHEGAIGMIDGKARLLKDDYCDGLGDCLPVCPAGAIRFVEREAAPYDPAACPAASRGVNSELRQWPVQLQLVPVNAPYFHNAHLLVAADCAAYACGDFHRDFIHGRTALIGCPKLDACDYSEKLAGILRQNNIKSVTAVRMEVPCCKGIELAVAKALEISGKDIPWQVAIITTDGMTRPFVQGTFADR